MVLDIEKYTVTDGKTPLSGEMFNARFYAIIRRLHALEELRVDWEASVAEVRNFGLARINDAVAPLVEDLRQQTEAALTDVMAMLSDLQAERAAMEAALSRAEAHLVLFGDGPPGAALGVDGNYFIDRLTGALWHRDAGVWAVLGGLTMPVGDSRVVAAMDTGAANAYVMTPTPALSALDPARLYLFKAAHANTGAATLNVSGLGAKAIVDRSGAALPAGAIAADQLVLVGYVAALDAFMVVGGGSSGAASTAAWTTADAAFARTADSAFTVTDNAANQAIFVAGRPVRYRQNSGTAWMYGVVTAYAAGAVTLAGAPLTAAIGGDAGRAMQYGDMTRLAQETFQIAGRFATVATSSALASYLLLNFVWLRGAAHCVGFRVRPMVDDSGAAQPRVNVVCNGGPVCTANAGAGLAVSDAAWTATTTDIDPATYTITRGQPLEVAVDANGTNDDARDLTVVVNFVLE